MTCSEYEVIISAYADGELTGNDLCELESHLSKCEACRKVLEEISILQRDMTVVLMEIPSTPHLAESVMSRVKPARTVRVRWAWAAAAIPAIAAACAVFFVQAHHGVNPAISVPTSHSNEQIVKDKPMPHFYAPPVGNPKRRVPGAKAHPIRIWHSPVPYTAIKPQPTNRVPKPMGTRPESPVPSAPQQTAQVTVEYVDGVDALAIAQSVAKVRSDDSVPVPEIGRPGGVIIVADTGRKGYRVIEQPSGRQTYEMWSDSAGGDGDM